MMSGEPTRAEARALMSAHLDASDRVLVTGAGGWFGLTVAALVADTAARTMFVTRRPRLVDFGSGTAAAVSWDWGAVQAFSPTVVVDCAFILRDFADSMPIEQYVYANTVLTARLLQVAQMDTVRAVISVSSGAAVHPEDARSRGVDLDPYGYLKRQAELALLGAADATGAATVIARPWSLSGSLVTRPARYAFSNLVMQARAGEIRIEAAHEVWRRFTGVDDFFAVALAKACMSSGVLDSGGELVEIGALARRICDVLGVSARIVRPAGPAGPPDEYCPPVDVWDGACSAVGFVPATLEEQVRSVDTHLRRFAG